MAYITKRKLSDSPTAKDRVILGFTSAVHKALTNSGVTHAQLFYDRSVDGIVVKFVTLQDFDPSMVPAPFPIRFGKRKGVTPIFCMIALEIEQAERAIPTIKDHYFSQYSLEPYGDTGLAVRIRLGLPINAFNSAAEMRAHVFGENARRMQMMKGMDRETIRREMTKTPEQVVEEKQGAVEAQTQEEKLALRLAVETRTENADMIFRVHGGAGDTIVVAFFDETQDSIYIWPGSASVPLKRGLRSEQLRLNKSKPATCIETIKMTVKLALRLDNPTVIIE